MFFFDEQRLKELIIMVKVLNSMKNVLGHPTVFWAEIRDMSVFQINTKY